MLDLKDDFLSIIKLDENLKQDQESYLANIKKRDELFKEIMYSLNNHREELRNEWGVKNYNYSKVCSFEDGDDMENIDYCFKVIFNGIPSAKELNVIEQITGCRLMGQLKREKGYYFKLPVVTTYLLPNSRRK